MDFFDSMKSKLLSRKFPMGHGAALTCPDMPFLDWSYTNGLGENIRRNNLDDFNEAAKYLYNQLAQALFKFDPDRTIHDTDSEDNIANFNQIDENFRNFREDDGHLRHAR